MGTLTFLDSNVCAFTACGWGDRISFHFFFLTFRFRIMHNGILGYKKTNEIWERTRMVGFDTAGKDFDAILKFIANVLRDASFLRGRERWPLNYLNWWPFSSLGRRRWRQIWWRFFSLSLDDGRSRVTYGPHSSHFDLIILMDKPSDGVHAFSPFTTAFPSDFSSIRTEHHRHTQKKNLVTMAMVI